MADRFLSELEWKRFSKANLVKDTALGKALAALETAKGPEGELKALDDIDKAVVTLKKENKSSVEVTGWLESTGKSADKQRKESEAALKKAAKEESDDEEDDPVLLTSKMIPLLRQVKKGDEMQVMIARGSREMAVLMSRKAISNSRRKMLTDYLKDGTPKFHKGTCVFEENSYTFVMDTQAGGMAKKLKAALFKQVDLRLKVRVRGPDGDLDDDGEPAEDDGLEAEGEEGTQAKGSVPEAPPLTTPEAPKVDAKAEYEKKWPDVEKRVLELLREGVGDVSKLRAVAEFVREKGDAGNYAAALQGMASLQKLIDAARPPEVPKAPPVTTAEAPKPGAKPEADAETAAFNKRLAALLPLLKEAMVTEARLFPKGKDAAREDTNRAEHIKLQISEAGVFARKRELEQANKLLDEAEENLTWLIQAQKEHQAEQGSESGESEQEQGEGADPKAAEYQALLTRLKPLYEQASSGGGLSGEQQAVLQTVTTAWNTAEDSATDGNYDRAILILRRLDEGGKLASLAGPRERGPSGDRSGVFRQRKFMLEEWEKIPAELRGQVQVLRTALADADEDADDLVDGIEDALDDLLQQIQDGMDQAINDGTPEAFKGLREQARSHPLMQHLQEAPGLNGGGLLASVEGALTRIEQGMLADKKAA